MLQKLNSVASLSCYSWIKYYFDLVGDSTPNGPLEIHLEPMEINEIWKEYKIDMIHFGEGYLSVGDFGKLWRGCFAYVKIREYKAVTGTRNVLCYCFQFDTL